MYSKPLCGRAQDYFLIYIRRYKWVELNLCAFMALCLIKICMPLQS